MERSRFLAFINQQHRTGKTALDDCAERGHKDSLKMLLGHGASFSLRGNAGKNSLNWAAAGGHLEVMTVLLDIAREKCGNQRQFQEFLDNRNVDGRTPLMEAAAGNKMTIVQRLLDYGADYTIGNKLDITPLHDASWRGFYEIATAIVNKGSECLNHERFNELLNRPNEQGKTPLIDASETGRTRIVKLLLESGADYTIQSNNGATALHWAAFRDKIDVVRTILEEASTRSSKTDANPEEEAKSFNSFINHQAHPNKATALRDAASQGYANIVKLFLAYGADYDCYDRANRSPLHYAVDRRNWDMVVALMDHVQKDLDKPKIKRFLTAKVREGDEPVWETAKKRGSPEVAKALDPMLALL